MKINSHYAMLDILGKKTSDTLIRKIETEGKIPVTITGFITEPSSGYDGVSREFEIDVSNVTIMEAE